MVIFSIYWFNVISSPGEQLELHPDLLCQLAYEATEDKKFNGCASLMNSLREEFEARKRTKWVGCIIYILQLLNIKLKQGE